MTKKKWFLPALICGILLLPVIWFTVVYLTMPGYAGHFDVVESNWDVTLPWDAGWQEVYGNNQRGGFHGRGIFWVCVPSYCSLQIATPDHGHTSSYYRTIITNIFPSHN